MSGMQIAHARPRAAWECTARRKEWRWPFSSLHRDVRAGLVPEDWAGDVEMAGAFGEWSAA